MNSIWQDVHMPEFPPLEGDAKTDVLVIGGGMAGLLCSHFLTKAGVDTTVVEENRICGGITKNTTAKITFQHGLIYHKLVKKLGMERAKMYLRAGIRALDAYRALCEEIPCGFETKNNYVYHTTDAAILEQEVDAVHRLGFPAEYKKELPLPFPTAGAVKFRRQAQFHPLEFAAGIAKELKIYENTSVRRLKGTTATTDRGCITAKKVIVATHFPFGNRHGSYFLKLYQQRSYVLALQDGPDVGGMFVSAEDGGWSFRNYGSYLLLGGNNSRTGKKSTGWEPLKKAAKDWYPDALPAYQWAAQDCITLDGVPYIGHYSALTPDVYVATGFNKWGMSSSMTAALILCDQIMEKEDPYAAIFNPSRSILNPQLAINALESACNLLRPTVPRCPHLGCALKWNRQERSWDCPCHGSRFDEQGHKITNPAQKDLGR